MVVKFMRIRERMSVRVLPYFFGSDSYFPV
jgi:hypothetical protein